MAKLIRLPDKRRPAAWLRAPEVSPGSRPEVGRCSYLRFQCQVVYFLGRSVPAEPFEALKDTLLGFVILRRYSYVAVGGL